MPTPTEEMWKKAAEIYKHMWRFPNCIRAIDSRHINIHCPINCRIYVLQIQVQSYYCFLAIVDPEYKCITIDVRSYGRNSNMGIFSNSVIGTKLHNKTLDIPEPTPSLENVELLPYIIVEMNHSH